jgi:hypothetical protein
MLSELLQQLGEPLLLIGGLGQVLGLIGGIGRLRRLLQVSIGGLGRRAQQGCGIIDILRQFLLLSINKLLGVDQSTQGVENALQLLCQLLLLIALLHRLRLRISRSLFRCLESQLPGFVFFLGSALGQLLQLAVHGRRQGAQALAHHRDFGTEQFGDLQQIALDRGQWHLQFLDAVRLPSAAVEFLMDRACM